MKLPLVNEAEAPQAKIVFYLLDPNHRSGKSKARFFTGHGYTVGRWQELAEALRAHASENEVVKQETTPLGVRLVVEGPLTLRDGLVAQIRSVWFIESGERAARLATAYPLRQRKRI
jgi:siroheme synthase